MSALIGQTVSHYHILEQLGQGGMATVYTAFDVRLERKVAIKVIRRDAFPPSILDNILKRFENEAKALAKLNHPNIVGVIDYGSHERAPYLVMPFIPSGTLKEKFDQPIHYSIASQILAPIARALAYAHDHKIIHRDVKPSNILITESGEPVLTDFGIAKVLEEVDSNTLTGTGMGLGTPEYMAPEQWHGKAEPSSDQYALGVIFFELITGKKPFSADTPIAVMLKQATEALPDPRLYIPELPEEVKLVLVKMLSKDPQNRFDSMQLLAKTLARLAIPEQETSDQTAVRKTQPISKSNHEDVNTFYEVPEEQTQNVDDLEKIEQPSSMKKDSTVESDEKLSESAIATQIDFPPMDISQVKQESSSMNESARPSKRKTKSRLKALIGFGVLIITAVVVLVIIQITKPNTSTTVDEQTNSVSTGSMEDVMPDTNTTNSEISELDTVRISEVDGMEMIYIPAGTFLMGNGGIYAQINEKPPHEVYLDGFWIDKYEVTNEQFAQCVQAGSCTSTYYNDPNLPDFSKHPVVYLSWNKAKEYCQWAGRRLPTEAQWEKAARNNDTRIYPWGNEEPTVFNTNFNKNIGEKTVAIGSYPTWMSPYGVLDMAGNVAEWVLDWYAEDYYASQTEWNNPQGPLDGEMKVLRGGSWNDNNDGIRSSFRAKADPSVGLSFTGVRCVWMEDQ